MSTDLRYRLYIVSLHPRNSPFLNLLTIPHSHARAQPRFLADTAQTHSDPTIIATMSTKTNHLVKSLTNLRTLHAGIEKLNAGVSSKNSGSAPLTEIQKLENYQKQVAAAPVSKSNLWPRIGGERVEMTGNSMRLEGKVSAEPVKKKIDLSNPLKDLPSYHSAVAEGGATFRKGHGHTTYRYIEDW
ncbi:hypothetical protein NPX13_g3605 [Xylaria arbuscula]|uniref:Uncharacterized protein n=1 Tax=Xylaria arbuscula TaxID=114810 RepID=A0A9W8NHX8_9PEZI|nr:hypothetical protein NPX13_g3605 [Xylaria arbuscula]